MPLQPARKCYTARWVRGACLVALAGASALHAQQPASPADWAVRGARVATDVAGIPDAGALGDITGDAAPRRETAGEAQGRSLDQLYARHPWLPRLLGAQFTYIGQELPPFHADYTGKNSLGNTGDFEGTHTYGVYFGSRVTSALQAYADIEMARGAGVGRAVGLAGLTNGDVIRQGSVDLSKGPYLARAYLRYLVPLGPGVDTATRMQDQVPGPEPTTRLELEAGKFALSDDFDVNRYANSTRYQFENWGLWNNPAWDFAADTRGYTNGVVAGYVHPRWMLHAALVQMPTFANGNVFDADLAQAFSLNAELTLRPGTAGTVIRILAYDNHGRMGLYREAIEIARLRDSVPTIVADDRKGRVKYGFGLDAEQPLADSGNTGLFMRLGWNDGKTEDFVFTESDRDLSVGLQLAGNAWHRARDRVGVALLVDGLSEDHKDYLAAGGLGFLLGDGRLTYATENIGEVYYRFELPVLTFCQVSPDYQYILHPGYNRARGPAQVIGIRVNLHY
jgi:high affinity Mn2+ porin